MEIEYKKEFIKKLIKSWDPDFTKLTSKELEKPESAKKTESINATNIDWDNFYKY
ncbi:MAG: hypothetical protein FWF92_02780 [Oscillospiraceae bacterium]|nr:hypothetical protein [Oscillospiraceae bacterium]